MTKNDIKELSIQVNLNGLSFCILNRSSNTIEFLNHIPFNQKLTPFDILNRLKTELSTNTVFSDDFDAVTVIHQNELSTLVPKELYDENHKADYLKFNAKILKTDYITHDELVANKSINVYIPYVNINNYIFETFGEFTYKHASTLLLDNIIQRATIHKTSEVFVNVNNATIEMAVTTDCQLQLYNTFEYETKEDFIYYVLFVFEQLNLDAETTKVCLSGLIEKNDDLYNILYTYVRHVHIVETDINYELSETIVSVNIHNHYLILNSF